MGEKIFITALDKHGDEMNLKITEYQLLLLIDILWVQRRNKLLGARLIDFYCDLTVDSMQEIKLKKIDMEQVKKILDKWRKNE